MLAAAIRNQITAGRPYWLREIISNDVRLVRTMLVAGSNSVETAESVLPILLNGADLPLAKSDDVLEAVFSFANEAFFVDLVDAAMRSVITCFLVDGRDSEVIGRFENSPEAARWLNNVSVSRLTDLLIQACYSGSLAVARAWKWIARAPRSLYHRRSPALPALCDSLLRFSHQTFLEGMQDALLQVLRRSSSESNADIRQALSAKMLRFALDHVSFPLGGVVAETFPDAYAVAIEEDHRP